MNGIQFRRIIRRLSKARSIQYRYEKRHGKGSHGTVFFGDKKTTVKSGEIGEGLLHDMLKQLGLSKKDLSE